MKILNQDLIIVSLVNENIHIYDFNKMELVNKIPVDQKSFIYCLNVLSNGNLV